MKVQIQNTEYYGEKFNLHIITLDSLNLGNNFTESHFKNALNEHEKYEDLKDYLRSQDVSDDFKIIAQGNYCKVSSLTYCVSEYKSLI